MALHPRLERPSLEAPPRRASNTLVAGVVLAVMGTGFALAMPIAMKTWTEAARRSEEVAKVRSATVPPADELGVPVQVPAHEVTPSPRARASRASEEEPQSTDAEVTPDERSGGRSHDSVSNPEDRDEQEPAEPSEQEAKRDEDEHEEDAPDDDADDDPDDTEPSARARDEDEEDTKSPPAEDDDDEDGSGSSGSKGDHGGGRSQGTVDQRGNGGNSNGTRGGNGD